MQPTDDAAIGPRRPSLAELGDDLLRLPAPRRWLSLLSPFVWSAAFFVLAGYGLWIPAVGCLVALSFVTYGSVSHDLVHRNLGLSSQTNDLLLTLVELLALRSGTAYRLAHLHHHRRYPAEDDVEGAAAGMTLIGALAEGVRFQGKLFLWAWRERPRYRRRLACEGALIVTAYAASVAALPWTFAPLVYAGLMTAGAWIIPLITSYLPHDPHGADEVYQTRAFRGNVLHRLAWGHLYHLEHHLYPAVPHHHWPELARRLEPYLRAAGVRPFRLWF